VGAGGVISNLTSVLQHSYCYRGGVCWLYFKCFGGSCSNPSSSREHYANPTCATATGSFRLQAILHLTYTFTPECSKHIWYRISNRSSGTISQTNAAGHRQYHQVLLLMHNLHQQLNSGYGNTTNVFDSVVSDYRLLHPIRILSPECSNISGYRIKPPMQNLYNTN
jgi:hypothetical protein